MRKEKNAVFDVIIIGGGVAGLAAAKKLESKTRRVLILEARSRIGGRVYPAARHGNVELGAEFVHGSAPCTKALIKKAHLKTVRVKSNFGLKRGSHFQSEPHFWSRLANGFKRIEKSDRISFASSLKKANLSAAVKGDLLAFVAGFHAADPKLVSAKSVAVTDAKDFESSRLKGGYRTLLSQLKPGRSIEMRFDHRVTKVDWRKSSVVVSCGRKRFYAEKVIVTLPLAILKSRRVKFTPALRQKKKALSLLETGPVYRFTFEFEKVFWNREYSFFQKRELAIPTWWTMGTSKPFLVGWAGGSEAIGLRKLSSRARLNACLESLALLFDAESSEIRRGLVNYWIHDWEKDPFSLGAYSYGKVGGENAAALLAEPLSNRLFFAGEATAGDGANGTVEGAIASGYRAAKEVR